MRVLLIGAGGALGGAVGAALRAAGHDVSGASRSSSPPLDLADPGSLAAGLRAVGAVDAVVNAGPGTPLRPLGELVPTQLVDDVTAKLFGQVELLRWSACSASVVVLTGGARPDLAGGLGGSLVNAALEAAVVAARRELPRGARAHLVAPGWIAETLPVDLGVHEPDAVPVAAVADRYRWLLEDPAAPAVVRVP